ncbi:hypothetical protein QCA50_007279 [Cerrena zonata]|uniref:Uncharacterized protein n=1 Tax=Cerrena zonata TaxID=2478898 RepID=A0AAW0GHV6_9APHY
MSDQRCSQNCASGAADAAYQCAILCNDSEDFHRSCSIRLQCYRQSAASEHRFWFPSGQGVAATLGACEAVWINESNAEFTRTKVNCVVVSGGGQGGCIADHFL